MQTGSSFWPAFGGMALVLILLYAIRPQLATGILWLFVILAAAMLYESGGFTKGSK